MDTKNLPVTVTFRDNTKKHLFLDLTTTGLRQLWHELGIAMDAPWLDGRFLLNKMRERYPATKLLQMVRVCAHGSEPAYVAMAKARNTLKSLMRIAFAAMKSEQPIIWY